MINLATCAFYFAVQPHLGQKKVRQEMFNEFMVVILSYHMFTFTSFVLDVKVKFLIGYSFIIVLCIVLFFNIFVMVSNQLSRFFSQRRKLKN